MSSVVKTLTPFLDCETLCQALEKVGCKYTHTLQGEKIITDRKDTRNGFQTFEKDKNGKYVLSAYSHTDKNQAEFVKSLEKYYNKLLPAVKEKQRQEYVEKQKQTVIAKAKAKGYSVREEKVNNKIKLVLVRNTY